MRRPTDEQIADAMCLLRSDGDLDGNAVADWIEHLLREAALKASARKAGVSMRNVRKYIKQVEGKSE